ncbi:DUF2169 domain-containing protein [Polyangium sp. y55x31]|uniref:DUF2169 family type VI secretion system accessory protein n=1 Tax=Polyangium sp. y55x31 TaxID=3042688 RepID=UPI002482B802|nr:DUF2169 domain-containing protein [Polyangium sp. y55x31]MDI1483585.1 DUF2169 domain-containing protein [Polyangium sp. y55x31]
MTIQNETPYPYVAAILPDFDGRKAFVLLVKATLRLTTHALTPAQEPIRRADVFFPSGALCYPCDLSLDHPGTDVIVHGTAHAPHGLPHATFTASITVADIGSRIRVTGPRFFRRTRTGFVVTEPDRVGSVALLHENAFGGARCSENPIGKGSFAPGEPPDGQPLPLLEDADAPAVNSPGDQPPPPAFGAIAPHWTPRSAYAGTYDDAWRRTRAPLAPWDLDRRFFCAAPPRLCTARPLVGGEPIELHALSPYGPLFSRVPRLPLRILVDGASHRPQLDRLVLEPDADRCILTYRLALPAQPRRTRIVEKRLLPKNAA